MGSINFDEGLKTFDINGDPNRTITINPADFGILERLEAAYARIEAAYGKLKGTEVTEEVLFAFSSALNREVDYIFNSEVSDIVFGGASPISTVGGVPLFQRFFEAVLPLIEEAVQSEAALSEERIAKYTEDLGDDRDASPLA